MKFFGIFGIVLFLAFVPPLRGQTFQLLHSFAGTDGADPYATLLQGSDGNLYGTTFRGGLNDRGTLFKMMADGTVLTLVSFNYTNGANPLGKLLEAKGGDFYGMTASGGVYEGGTAFKMTSDGTLTTLVNFDGTNGASPVGGFVEGSDGDFYGTTYYGGTNGSGTVFKITTNGALTTLVSFGPDNGFAPRGELILGNDGNFYGTTQYGSTNTFGAGLAWGTAFQMTPEGVLTTLVSFKKTDGAYPWAGLVQGTDGSFYGTTDEGGAYNRGTVFRMTIDGALTTIATFNITNGMAPRSELVIGTDGNLYGTTKMGGLGYYVGMVFRVAKNGSLSTLYRFGSDVSLGYYPNGGLLQATDGNLYGTTSFGGAFDSGTIFRIVMPVALNSQVNGNELILSWPTNALGFTLQSATDLNSPTNWIDFTNAPAVVGAQFMVTNLISDSPRFFRLKKP